MPWSGKHGLITRVYLRKLLYKLSNPLGLIHGPSCFHPRNLGFTADLRRLFTTAELCSHAQTIVQPSSELTFSPRRSLTIFDLGTELTEYNCQSVNLCN